MPRKPERVQLDPVSTQAVARVVLVSGYIGAWCTFLHIMTARPVTPVPLLIVASLVAVGHATSRKEKPLAACLNRWDEAVALLGLGALAQVVVRMMTA